MNEKKIFETQEAKIKSLQEQVIKGNDSIKALNVKIKELNYIEPSEDVKK